jgi:hypothetical protein
MRPAIFFQPLPCCSNPCRNKRCSSAVQRPVFSPAGTFFFFLDFVAGRDFFKTSDSPVVADTVADDAAVVTTGNKASLGWEADGTMLAAATAAASVALELSITSTLTSSSASSLFSRSDKDGCVRWVFFSACKCGTGGENTTWLGRSSYSWFVAPPPYLKQTWDAWSSANPIISGLTSTTAAPSAIERSLPLFALTEMFHALPSLVPLLFPSPPNGKRAMTTTTYPTSNFVRARVWISIPVRSDPFPKVSPRRKTDNQDATP